VSSMASIDPFPGFAAYAAAKAGLNMLTHVTAREGAAIGLKAVAIAPGAVETPMLRSAFDERAIPRHAALSPQAVASLIADCITGRRAFQPGEVIQIVP
jgi:NAD(P)-dependent dehydrogenase (short-subunit alcohol dehydrogenase family)